MKVSGQVQHYRELRVTPVIRLLSELPEGSAASGAASERSEKRSGTRSCPERSPSPRGHTPTLLQGRARPVLRQCRKAANPSASSKANGWGACSGQYSFSKLSRNALPRSIMINRDDRRSVRTAIDARNRPTSFPILRAKPGGHRAATIPESM